MEELLNKYRLPISIYEHMQAENINNLQLLESKEIIKSIQMTLKPVQVTKFNKLLEELEKQVSTETEENENNNILLHSETNANVKELYIQYYLETWQLENNINLILDSDESKQLSKVKTKLEQSKNYHQERAKRILSLLQQKDQKNLTRIMKSNIRANVFVNELNCKFKHNTIKFNKHKAYNLRSTKNKKVHFSSKQDTRSFHKLGLIIIILSIMFYAIIKIKNIYI